MITDIQTKYFIRNVRHYYCDGKVVLIENKRPGVATMDEWPQLIYLEATGQMTIKSFIEYISKEYDNGPPPELGEQILGLMIMLEKSGFIRFDKNKQKLPYYLELPVEKQDRELALKLMKKDGFI